MKKKKSPTLADIANELNIDVSTVSKALSDDPKISEQTKKKVRKIVSKLNYRPNHIATALVKGKSNLLGVMVPHTDENFFAGAIRGIEETAKKAGYQIIIFQSNDKTEDEIQNLSIMLEAKVVGILASHALQTSNFDHYQNVLDQGIPLILFDRFDDSVESEVVAIDDFKGAYNAVTHLINQGCKKIAHISGYQHVHIYKERLRGYTQALLDNDLPLDKTLIFESDMTLKNGCELAEKMLQSQPIPDAIFASNDYTALGAIQVLKEHNINIPEQVAVVGFSNEAFTTFVTPTISTVEQHSRKLGEKAVQLFINVINDETPEKIKDVPTKIIVTPELIVRESSLKS